MIYLNRGIALFLLGVVALIGWAASGRPGAHAAVVVLVIIAVLVIWHIGRSTPVRTG